MRVIRCQTDGRRTDNRRSTTESRRRTSDRAVMVVSEKMVGARSMRNNQQEQ